MKQKTHIFDVDQVLAPDSWILLANEHLESKGEKTVEEHEINSPFYFSKQIFNTPEKMTSFLDFYLSQEIYANLSPIEGSVDCLQELSETDKVILSSKVLPLFKGINPAYNHRFAITEFDQKLRWLAKHFPFIPAHSSFNITASKDMLHGYSIVDDNLEFLTDNFNNNSDNFKKRLLFSRPHNLNISQAQLDAVGSIRVNDFKEIKDQLMEVK